LQVAVMAERGALCAPRARLFSGQILGAERSDITTLQRPSGLAHPGVAGL